MLNLEHLYYPVLRLKEGEYVALTTLPPSVANLISPVFVVAPPKERDPELGRALQLDECAYFAARRIASYWPNRLCFIEARFVLKEFGHEDSNAWLPRLFDLARKNGGIPVPVVSLKDAVGESANAFKVCISSMASIRLGIRVSFNDIDEDLVSKLKAALNAQNIRAQESVVFIDFAEADISDPDIVSDVLLATFHLIQEAGDWAKIVFQATNFPETNPAPVGGSVKIDRTEWKVWRKLAQTDSDVLNHLAFGDFGADSAKFEFKSGGAKPIPHLRYCGSEEWHVIRGGDLGKQETLMRSVARSVLDCGSYMGRSFSDADDQIYRMAHGLMGCGTATNWRGINTAHHITKVVNDLGKIYGFVVKPQVVADEFQADLFINESV